MKFKISLSIIIVLSSFIFNGCALNTSKRHIESKIKLIWSDTTLTLKPINDFKEEGDENGNNNFIFLDKKYDLNKSKKVATYSIYCLYNNTYLLFDIFDALNIKANKLGANSFSMDEYKIKNQDSILFTMSVYFTSEENIAENNKLYQKNKVFVMGGFDTYNYNVCNFKINGNEESIVPLNCFEVDIPIDGFVEVDLGGVLGSSFKAKYEIDKLPKYISLKGSSVSPRAYGNSFGISYSPGNIFHYDLNLGQFLMHFITPTKYNKSVEKKQQNEADEFK